MATPNETPAKPAAASPSPGVLRSAVSMQIQTRQAQSLVLGRGRDSGKPPIIGLDGFGRYVTQIWNSAAADDPYADMALLRIEQQIELAQKAVRANIRELTAVLESMPGIEIGLAESVEPLRVPLVFSNPYGYLGAYLLHDFDELARTVLTARRCALIDRDRAFALLFRAGRPIRRAYCLPPVVWRYTGVTRADIAADKRLAQQAKFVYAAFKVEEPGADVLQGERRSRHAPPIRKAAAPAASYLDIEDEDEDGGGA